jgi:hypothetical protein
MTKLSNLFESFYTKEETNYRASQGTKQRDDQISHTVHTNNQEKQGDITLKMFWEKIRIMHVLHKVIGILLLSLAGMYLYEVLPRFITPAITLPSDDYHSQIWAFPTYSVITPGHSRYFTWREYTILSHEVTPEKTSRQLILNHFDKQLQMQGWTRNEYDPKSFGNCYDERIFPEAAFLHPAQDLSQDGYITYKRENGFSFITSKERDEICVAIWRHWENVQGVFNVIIQTVKPSPLTWFLFRN